ncbi:hypothetical protein Q5P01_009545 [Channa striata]|uniref:Uncharacterized protein n=1 Tax=Channa striata TaxID=64152 RepID=A0AA88MZ18_CHASR|nr:hypothetical protein Q5P01_009545 [Channa striata]
MSAEDWKGQCDHCEAVRVTASGGKRKRRLCELSVHRWTVCRPFFRSLQLLRRQLPKTPSHNLHVVTQTAGSRTKAGPVFRLDRSTDGRDKVTDIQLLLCFRAVLRKSQSGVSVRSSVIG